MTMPGKKSSNPIIRTKLHRPPLAADFVPRPRLLERLEANRRQSLSLICAPAGYGKSTLASSWLESGDSLNAWVSLDEGENDLHSFLLHFLTAIRSIFPNGCRESWSVNSILRL